MGLSTRFARFDWAFLRASRALIGAFYALRSLLLGFSTRFARFDLNYHINVDDVFDRFTGFLDSSGKSAGGFHTKINDSASNEGSYSAVR